MKKIVAAGFGILLACGLQASVPVTERWGVFEARFEAPATGNPFLETELKATFSHEGGKVTVAGFYDGDDRYIIRFMPDRVGEWTYITESNVPNLDGLSGEFRCVPATAPNRGPVRVAETFHFRYDDGTPYFPIGTTGYVWHLQDDESIAETLKTLAASPFNKVRMCVLPDHYRWNLLEPRAYPYVGTPPDKWDLSRFNPAYFRHLEKIVQALGDIGIEADLVLLHPYDYSWGFDEMSEEQDLRFIEYVVARLSAYRNVWWSLSNEYDLMKRKSEAQWDLYFQHVQALDPYGHLRSIHNGVRWYDHSQPWVTHLSLQHQNLEEVADFRRKYGKPVLIDECGYEGNLPVVWGNLTARELVHRFWTGMSRGGYVTHGESYLEHGDPEKEHEERLFMFHGGRFSGESVPRIDFLKQIVSTFPGGLDPPENGYWAGRGGAFSEPDVYLYYLGYQQPVYIEVELPEDGQYTVEIIDTWGMTVTRGERVVSGKTRIELSGASHLAVVCRRVPER